MPPPSRSPLSDTPRFCAPPARHASPQLCAPPGHPQALKDPTTSLGLRPRPMNQARAGWPEGSSPGACQSCLGILQPLPARQGGCSHGRAQLSAPSPGPQSHCRGWCCRPGSVPAADPRQAGWSRPQRSPPPSSPCTLGTAGQGPSLPVSTQHRQGRALILAGAHGCRLGPNPAGTACREAPRPRVTLLPQPQEASAGLSRAQQPGTAPGPRSRRRTRTRNGPW